MLIFTNPIFSLFILLVGLNYLGKLTNHIIFATNTEGFLYMLLQIGLEQKLIIFSLIYSLIFHLTYVFLQPAYKIEKSRLALETVTFGYAIISILGLAYSKDISKVLFEYLIITPYFGKDFFQAAQFSGFDTIASLSGFTSFFEKTFKLFLLPFTVCASLAMIIFKFREISSKNRANKYFQKAAFSQDISPNEQITLLKKALYYGGGTMKNAIVGHHFLYKVVPDLLLEPSNKPSLMRYWLRKLLVLYRYYRIKINNKKLLLSDRYQCIKAEFNDNKKFIKSLPIAKKIKLYFGIIFYFIFFLFICNSIKYVKYYSDLAGSYYLKILNNDIVLAYYWAFIVYTGVVCTILYKKAFHYSESKAVRVKIYKRKDIIRFTANFLWLVAMISTYIFDIIHQKWIVLIFLLCFVHIIWFLTITFENEKNNGL
ncbi:hypothetical protein [Paenibacillus polymyxa]|uniref:hypothetical protein n=2 Tax=Paenibacillus polymyxa TaxID=1406 RepID=UPI001689965E|nr:hypothetical protein [Paenibacillus polymyxa]